MTKLTYSKLSVLSLVEEREKKQWVPNNNVLFVTISPNPSMMLPILKGSVKTKMAYGKLNQRHQYEYCERMLKSVLWLLPKTAESITTVELQEGSHNVHLHTMIRSPEHTTDYDIQIFRRECSNLTEVMRNRKKGAKFDSCISIVWWDDPSIDLIKYFDKDFPQKMRHFNNITTNGEQSVQSDDIPHMISDLTVSNFKYLEKVIL